MKKIVLYNLLFFFTLAINAQSVKNVIVMIPDGTSTSVLAAARWYKAFLNPNDAYLNIDPYIKGLVITNSSDAPIGDSAPTTSCYMTGYPTQTQFVSTYPVKTDHDLVQVDATRAYQPLTTLLEASKQLKDKATGLVFTCEFPHATPADCAAHTYKRSKYGWIAPQMVHNKVDVVIGGGVSYLNERDKNFLLENGYTVLLNDYQGMKQCNKAPFWALYSDYDMPYDLERDPKTTPSLAEMTRKAIQVLSQNEQGFFLMVEGSKVDWAAHNNDAKAILTEFIAFDDACGEALQFAQKDGQTLVIILPDHGNSAMTIGGSLSKYGGYDKVSLEQIMKPIVDHKLSTSTMAGKVKDADEKQVRALFKEYYNIDLQDAEMAYLNSASNYNKSTIPYEERKNNLGLDKMISLVLNNRTYFGFTTYGHTGENVFLGCYNPAGNELTGVHTNVEVNHYLRQQLGLAEDDLERLTEENFADHHVVFADYNCQIDSLSPNDYRLTVKNKKTTLTVDSYTNYVTVNKKKFDLGSVVVYMPANKTFYLPRNLDMYLNLKQK